MGNRNHDQSGQSRPRRQENWRDEEYSRGDRGQGHGSGDNALYGQYTESDEGESSVRAGSYDAGRQQSGRGRDSRDQSGSTGRYAGYGDFGQGEYGGGRSGWSGQDRYGQSGYGQGNQGQGNQGQSGYGYDAGSYGSQRGGQSPDYGDRQASYSQPSGYGRSGWNEPLGEGQQRSQGIGYGGSTRRAEYGQQSGQHHGKGPKGYQRSDDRIKEMLCERLREDPEIDPSEVSITVQGGKITLDGTVDSRQTKNAIEEAADQFGASDVQNNLRVQRPAQGTETQNKQGKGVGNDDNAFGRQKQH